MKKIIVIASALAFLAQAAVAQANMAADTTKPIKVRTKKVEIIVGDKTVKSEGDDDVNVSAGGKKVIVRKIKKTDGSAQQPESGDRKIVLKSGTGDTSIVEEKIIVRKRKSADGKEETIIVDTDEIERTIDAEMDALESQMDALEKEMDAQEKEMAAAEKEMDKAKNEADRSAASAKMTEIGNEMTKIGNQMTKIGNEMGDIKVDINTDESDVPKAKKAKTDEHARASVKNRFIMFDFGVNGLMQNGNFNLTGAAEPLEIFYGKSFFYRIGAFQQRVPLTRDGHLNFMWGADVEFDNIELSRAVTLSTATAPIEVIAESKSFKQNRLYSSWVDVPIAFQFQTSRKSSKGFRIGVGAFGGLLLAALQDQDERDGKAQKTDMGSNFNKVRYGAQVNIGSGPINLVARYSVSPLFLENKGLGMNAFNIGVSVIPF